MNEKAQSLFNEAERNESLLKELNRVLQRCAADLDDAHSRVQEIRILAEQIQISAIMNEPVRDDLLKLVGLIIELEKRF